MISVDVLDDFDAVDQDDWARLLGEGSTSFVFMYLIWQRAWWQAFGRGQLTILVVRNDDETVAIAPLFVDGGMAFLVGSGGSDYLDLVGALGPDGWSAVLRRLFDCTVGLLGVRLYHVPDDSVTSGSLQQIEGFAVIDEGHLNAPQISSAADLVGLAQKKRLVRYESVLRRDGDLRIEHLRSARDVSPLLEGFFEQHRQRWHQFDEPSERDFIRRVVAADPPWLRFSRLIWNDVAIAAHLGFCDGHRYLYYKPTLDLTFAKYSPGQVLLRQLLLSARAEGVDHFDLGLGEEEMKSRFADSVKVVRTWGIYPA